MFEIARKTWEANWLPDRNIMKKKLLVDNDELFVLYF